MKILFSDKLDDDVAESEGVASQVGSYIAKYVG